MLMKLREVEEVEEAVEEGSGLVRGFDRSPLFPLALAAAVAAQVPAAEAAEAPPAAPASAEFAAAAVAAVRVALLGAFRFAREALLQHLFSLAPSRWCYLLRLPPAPVVAAATLPAVPVAATTARMRMSQLDLEPLLLPLVAPGHRPDHDRCIAAFAAHQTQRPGSAASATEGFEQLARAPQPELAGWSRGKRWRLPHCDGLPQPAVVLGRTPHLLRPVSLWWPKSWEDLQHVHRSGCEPPRGKQPLRGMPRHLGKLPRGASQELQQLGEGEGGHCWVDLVPPPLVAVAVGPAPFRQQLHPASP
mmetsp:Transcript_32576/g.69854  ORF Transcript_32576/g.69854 Transcript_32576/m.69854 type:complete len:304 (-) Transcript_32576:1382-2293(-)